MILFSAIV